MVQVERARRDAAHRHQGRRAREARLAAAEQPVLRCRACRARLHAVARRTCERDRLGRNAARPAGGRRNVVGRPHRVARDARRCRRPAALDRTRAARRARSAARRVAGPRRLSRVRHAVGGRRRMRRRAGRVARRTHAVRRHAARRRDLRDAGRRAGARARHVDGSVATPFHRLLARAAPDRASRRRTSAAPLANLSARTNPTQRRHLARPRFMHRAPRARIDASPAGSRHGTHLADYISNTCHPENGAVLR
ncbi:hypothetical protein BVI1335_1010107 [Burkholderia vietnamiensis]|nr:hypothetical protein BVI1335_1010107 [Burkholderia vietnamiensis]